MALICSNNSAVFFAVSLFKIMLQMYKVFVNDKPIILTDSLKKDNNFPVFVFKDLVIDELIYRLKTDSVKGANLFTLNIEESFNQFKPSWLLVTSKEKLFWS